MKKRKMIVDANSLALNAVKASPLRRSLLALAFALLPATVWAQGLSLDADAAVDTGSATKTATAADTAAAAANAAGTSAQKRVSAAPRRTVQRQSAPVLLLRDIRFTPSGYLSAAALDAVEEQFKGRRFTPNQFGQIAQAFTQLYVDREIALAEARITNVNYATGTMDIQLFEARIGTVSYQSQSASARYLDFRLGLNEGDLADNRVISDRLTRLAITDGLRADAAFNPGQSVGETDLTIAIENPPRFGGAVTLDNYGSKANGEFRLTTSGQYRNVSGWNDVFGYSLTLREGAIEGSASYRRVVERSGGALTLGVSASHSDTVRAPDVQGDALTATLEYAWPIIAEEGRGLTFRAIAAGFREESKLAGVPILDQSGYALTFGLTFTRQGQGQSLSGNVDLTLGTYDDAIVPAQNQGYSAVRANATFARTLGQDLLGSITFGGQYALDGPLPSQSQFSVTSPFAVRGYPVSTSEGDSGWYARLQVEKASPYGGPLSLRPFAFVDVGEAHDLTPTGHVPLGTASSVGLGVTGTYRDNLVGDLYLAKPLTNVTGFTNADDTWTVRARLSFVF